MSFFHAFLPALGAWWRGLPAELHWFLAGVVALAVFGAWVELHR